MRRILLIVVMLGLAPRAARAEDELTWRPVLDGGIVIGGGFLWILTETSFKGGLAPEQCRWCEDNGLDRGWREALRWDDTGLAHDLSNVVGFGVVPAASLGLGAVAAGYDGRFGDYPMDAVLMLEAMVIAIDINQLVKISFGRERPFVHALADPDKQTTEHPEDNNLSFYSGHTTFAFALATAAGTIASMRKYKLEPVVWAVGMTAATATGWLRVAADKHYFTDVMLGGLTGAAVGLAVPWIHKGKRPPVVPVPVRGGVGLAWNGYW